MKQTHIQLKTTCILDTEKVSNIYKESSFKVTAIPICIYESCTIYSQVSYPLQIMFSHQHCLSIILVKINYYISRYTEPLYERREECIYAVQQCFLVKTVCLDLHTFKFMSLRELPCISGITHINNTIHKHERAE